MKILISSPIDPDAIDQLSRQHDVVRAFKANEQQLRKLIEDREVLVFRSGINVNAELMDRAPGLKLLVRAGSGYDNVDLPYVIRRGLEFIRIPEPGAKAVAELTFALMLSLARSLLVADRLLRQGHWAKHELNGYLLNEKTLGIIGVGNIGSRVGRLGAAWGMNVIGCVEHPSRKLAAELGQQGIHLTDFDDVLAQADFVTIHVPLQESTYNLIDANALNRMKPGAYLLNLARGGVVDEQALYHVLAEGSRLAGAALDVHAEEGEGKISPLHGLSQVILTPHIGANTVDTQREIGSVVVTIISDLSRVTSQSASVA